jgi:hypothetical protein
MLGINKIIIMHGEIKIIMDGDQIKIGENYLLFLLFI